ncbi:hypothetical protein RHGRI_013757 [Rhododendron griersonianum]|uniref:Thioredoxin domain-containing protein n=1 Tax=Rhododendron griersonianum TaxID=479676 RepID=A0AAV6K6R3_9ERIC|nr:hypothetical protein RHGRI_013757 [Rhododendron griersonianum]
MVVTAAVVTRKSWDKLILSSDTPVLVEFHATWCGPCRMVHRVIDELATDYAGKLKCFVLHADNDLEIAENYDVKAVPVVLLFKNGERRESVVGTMPKEFYVDAIERYKCDGIGAVVNGEKSIGEKAKSPRTKDVIWTILIQNWFNINCEWTKHHPILTGSASSTRKTEYPLYVLTQQLALEWSIKKTSEAIQLEKTAFRG